LFYFCIFHLPSIYSMADYWEMDMLFRRVALEEEQRKLDEKGIRHGIRGVRDLDEASSAYKDIDEVMEAQKNLVEIVTTLEPLAVVKG